MGILAQAGNAVSSGVSAAGSALAGAGETLIQNAGGPGGAGATPNVAGVEGAGIDFGQLGTNALNNAAQQQPKQISANVDTSGISTGQNIFQNRLSALQQFQG